MTTTLTAEELAKIFFKEWYCKNRLPLEIISDHDKLFISCFWKSIHRLTLSDRHEIEDVKCIPPTNRWHQ